jgi:hypothetical protein
VTRGRRPKGEFVKRGDKKPAADVSAAGSFDISFDDRNIHLICPTGQVLFLIFRNDRMADGCALVGSGFHEVDQADLQQQGVARPRITSKAARLVDSLVTTHHNRFARPPINPTCKQLGCRTIHSKVAVCPDRITLACR